MKSIHLLAPLTIAGAMLLTSCATESKIRRDIAADLNQLIEASDCPTTCDTVKWYLRTQLGQ